MLVILRLVFGAGLLYGFSKVRENAQSNPEAGDLMNAFYLAVCVILGILNAVVWAPYFGARISEPLTGTLTSGPAFDPRNRWLRLILKCEHRGHRRLTLMLCFLEGVRHPDLPAAFVIGLRNAAAGSWWERLYAREVFKFDNAQNCLQAFQTLKRHGVDPGYHSNQAVNLVLRSLEKPVKAEPEKIDLPRAPQTMPVRRNVQIQLFETGERPEPPGGGSAAAGLPGKAGGPSVPAPEVPSGNAPPTQPAETRVSPDP